MGVPVPAAWKRWLPEPVRRWWRRRFGWRWFHGDYGSWAEACAEAEGYDDPCKTDRILAAARAVRAGKAAWDRDGALFYEPVSHVPLLDVLQSVARAHGGRLNVIDFGGGLGSTWWQHRRALAPLQLSWRVVERAEFVAAGQREFSDAVLSFHTTLAEAQAGEPVQVILLSSVLPYFDDPHALLQEVAAGPVPHVVVDRTPFIAGDRDRLVVHRAPLDLGGGCYPCWLFHRTGVVGHFRGHYFLAGEWPVAFDRADDNVAFCGLHFQRRPDAPVPPASPDT